MLTHIHIRDFVIVEELELAFASGMTALTGETGAGKSILIDALGLALGDRAGQEVIRHGADRAEIAATFDLTDQPAVQRWLEDQDLAEDDECHLRRIVSREGRSRAYINGRPAPVQQLRELGDQLVDIHGQHEHQSLMKRDAQRDILDGYAGQQDTVRELGRLYDHWHQQQTEYDTLRDAARDRSDRIDLLRFHVEELEALNLQAGEIEQLDEEHGRLANAGELISACQNASETLYDADGSAHEQISHHLHELQEMLRKDPALSSVCDMLDSARIQLEEAASELRGYAEGLDIDPARLDELEQRIATLQQLARKHRVRPEELPQVLETARTELDHLDHADQHLDRLEQAIADSAETYRQQAATLHRHRVKAAKQLGDAITEAMQGLGMQGGRFEVAVEPLDKDQFTRHGQDRIEFRVSANPGQPVAALTRVASGGELSRISLAIQVITSQLNTTPSMIFDEVDTGIGGAVAEVVGQKLRALGEQHQVLCVTHLPQVAAQAHQHLQVSKLHGDEVTHSQIRVLDEQDRVEEIARMLGGTEITRTTLAHAQEMIDKGRGKSKKTATKKKAVKKKK